MILPARHSTPALRSTDKRARVETDPRYCRYYEEDSFVGRFLRDRRRSAERLLENARGETGLILDVGCGGGQYFETLREMMPSATIVGVDVSPEMCAFAAARGTGRVVRGDAHRLPLGDVTGAAGAILVGVLNTRHDFDRILWEARRCIRPGGWIVATLNARESILGRIRGWGPFVVLRTRGFGFSEAGPSIPRREIEGFFSARGFHVEAREGIYFTIFGLRFLSEHLLFCRRKG